MNFSKYINIPYKHKGSDFLGCDCWGLIKLIMREEKNIELPEFWYTEFWDEEYKNCIKDNIKNVSVKKVVQPFNVFDGVLFYNQGKRIVSHIGLIVEEDKFIHMYLKNASKIDRLGGYWMSKLYQGVRYSG